MKYTHVAWTSVLSVIVAWSIYIIHNLAPFMPWQCIAFSIKCPIPESNIYGLIDKNTNSNVQKLDTIFHSWMNDGFVTSAQASLFVENEEVLNYHIKDLSRRPNFDETSLLPMFSCSKNFAAIMIAVAIDKGWIHSYHDAIADYWEEFPQKRIILSFEDYSLYYDTFSNDINLLNNMTNLFDFYANTTKIRIENDYYSQIKDVLRHDSGFGINLNNYGIDLTSIDFGTMKDYIERHEYLIYFKETPRVYHAINRGWILNQLFINVEPQHRSMYQYFKDEFLPILKEKHDDLITKQTINKINTNINTDDTNTNIGHTKKNFLTSKTKNEHRFFLDFDGINDESKELQSQLYYIESQPLLWTLYHMILPYFLGLNDTINNEKYDKEFCNTTRSILECNLIGLKSINYYMTVQSKIFSAYIPKHRENVKPEHLTRLLVENGLKMEQMSWSGISNAHSMAFAVNNILFSDNISQDRDGQNEDENNGNNNNINKDFVSWKMLNKMIKDDKKEFDFFLGFDTNMTQGGFRKSDIGIIDSGKEKGIWYGWGGWGGSILLFAPKYKATIAFTLGSFEFTLLPRHMYRTVATSLTRVMMDYIQEKYETATIDYRSSSGSSGRRNRKRKRKREECANDEDREKAIAEAEKRRKEKYEQLHLYRVE